MLDVVDLQNIHKSFTCSGSIIAVHLINSGVKKHNFEDFATDEDKEIVRKAKDWDISDDDYLNEGSDV